jgi:low temperature requirement protein LtrA
MKNNFISYFHKTNFRKPKAIDNSKQEHRAASPLELFVDLAFVAAFSTLVHFLIEQKTLGPNEIFGYALRFLSLFSLWMNTTWYNNMFEENTIRHRSIMVIIIIQVLFMQATFTAHYFEGYLVLLLAYAFSRFFQTYIWYTASSKMEDPAMRFGTRVYAISGALAASLALGVFAIQKEPNVIVWSITVLLELIFPTIYLGYVTKKTKNENSANHNLLRERFGLLYILALGEGIVAAGSLLKQLEATLHAHDEMLAVRLMIGAIMIVILAYLLWELFFEIAQSDANKYNPLNVVEWVGLTAIAIFATLTTLGISQELILSSNSNNNTIKQIFLVAYSMYVLAFPLMLEIRDTRISTAVPLELRRKAQILYVVAGIASLLIAIFLSHQLSAFATLCIVFIFTLILFIYRQYVAYVVGSSNNKVYDMASGELK